MPTYRSRYEVLTLSDLRRGGGGGETTAKIFTTPEAQPRRQRDDSEKSEIGGEAHLDGKVGHPIH